MVNPIISLADQHHIGYILVGTTVIPTRARTIFEEGEGEMRCRKFSIAFRVLFLVLLILLGCNKKTPVNVIVEPIPPETEIISVADTISYTGAISFRWKGSDEDGSVVRYEYRIDQNQWTSTTNDSLTFTGLGEGQYKFEVRSIDNDGNLDDTPAIVLFEVIFLKAPKLLDLSFLDTDGTYSVIWTLVDNATLYTLQEDTTSSFSAPLTVYEGSDTSVVIKHSEDGVFYYRVKESAGVGKSVWSNTESITVLVNIPIIGSWQLKYSYFRRMLNGEPVYEYIRMVFQVKEDGTYTLDAYTGPAYNELWHYEKGVWEIRLFKEPPKDIDWRVSGEITLTVQESNEFKKGFAREFYFAISDDGQTLTAENTLSIGNNAPDAVRSSGGSYRNNWKRKL